MSKYIDKDKLLIRFEQLKKSADNLQDAFFLDGVMAVIDTQPTADVQPVQRGKWIEREDGTYCSGCGKKPIPDIDYDLFWQPDCCPNCGSYNREEGEENE